MEHGLTDHPAAAKPNRASLFTTVLRNAVELGEYVHIEFRAAYSPKPLSSLINRDKGGFTRDHNSTLEQTPPTRSQIWPAPAPNKIKSVLTIL